LSPVRKALFTFFSSRLYEVGITSVIFLSMVLVIKESDATAGGERPALWMDVSNYFLLVLFGTEVSLRIYVFRETFFSNKWNVIDFAIFLLDFAVIMVVLFSDASGEPPALNALRVARLLRLARSYRLAQAFPNLSLVIKGLLGAFQAAFWGMVLVLFMLIVFSIVAVQIIHPVNEEVAASTDLYDGCDRCERAFSSVANSTLTFVQQLLAGDSWGAVTIPIIEHAPATAVFFGIVIIINNLLILNLILGLIVDTAGAARRSAEHEVALGQDKARLRAMKKFRNLCLKMDQDGSGTLTKDELADGFDNEPEFQDCLKSMGINKDDMSTVCSIMDQDNSGTIEVDEFAEKLHEMKCSDPHTLLCFIKHYVTDIKKDLDVSIKASMRNDDQVVCINKGLGEVLSTFATSPRSKRAGDSFGVSQGAQQNSATQLLISERSQESSAALPKVALTEVSPRQDRLREEAPRLGPQLLATLDREPELFALLDSIKDEIVLNRKHMTRVFEQNTRAVDSSAVASRPQFDDDALVTSHRGAGCTVRSASAQHCHGKPPAAAAYACLSEITPGRCSVTVL